MGTHSVMRKESSQQTGHLLRNCRKQMVREQFTMGAFPILNVSKQNNFGHPSRLCFHFLKYFFPFPCITLANSEEKCGMKSVGTSKKSIKLLVQSIVSFCLNFNTILYVTAFFRTRPLIFQVHKKEKTNKFTSVEGICLLLQVLSDIY